MSSDDEEYTVCDFCGKRIRADSCYKHENWYGRYCDETCYNNHLGLIQECDEE